MSKIGKHSLTDLFLSSLEFYAVCVRFFSRSLIFSIIMYAYARSVHNRSICLSTVKILDKKRDMISGRGK